MTEKLISSTVADWSREHKVRGEYEPWKNLLKTLRFYQKIIDRGGLVRLIKPIIVMQHRFWSAVCGADIPLNSNLGGGLIMRHPNGIVIHPNAKIGPNCLISQQVTIGYGSTPGIPKIGGNVNIGSGAKILGGITIGNNVFIGANSVVLTDIPNNCTAVGVPARIIKNDALEK